MALLDRADGIIITGLRAGERTAHPPRPELGGASFVFLAQTMRATVTRWPLAVQLTVKR
jgi:hypothetical protein